ncbi:MAG: hypothetical protein JWM34_3952 [Ilumatobacteraceae bacterium]|nr:hypothetical protein [Ilumatobacteraceae bacterium]
MTRPASPNDQWLFDIDGTLVDSFDAQHLRPLVIDLFEAVRQARGAIAVWSAGGIAHAQAVISRHGLHDAVDSFHPKDIDACGRWSLPHRLDLEHTICVDDQPAQLPAVGRTFTVFPYLRANPHDRGLSEPLAFATSLRRRPTTTHFQGTP